MSDLLSNLNPAQRRAVEHDTGPMLIVAGAGTGKTTVLINRLLYLVQERGVDPNEILILTFTDKAAGELSERADRALPLGQTADWIRTFHGLGRSILERHALDIGLPGDYKQIDDTGVWILLKKHLAEFNFDYYRPLGNPNKYLADLRKHFSRLKDENITPTDYLAFADSLEKKQTITGYSSADELDVQRVKELAGAYQVYSELLLKNGFLDYGDLIMCPLRLFKERPNILKAYQQQFKYIMVDEFQDTNFSQYQLVKVLADGLRNLTVVGDDDQSIYKFRGASLSNIMQFRTDYPETIPVVLNENYRSGQVILDAAYSSIIQNNPNRLEAQEALDKSLRSNAKVSGEVVYWSLPDVHAENAAVAAKILELHEAGLADWKDIAILMRANSVADRFVKELSRKNIPFQYLSHRGLYFKPVVLDFMNYLRLLDNYHESAALFRVLSMPSFYMDQLDVINLSRVAREHQWSLYEALAQPAALAKLSAEGAAAATKLLSAILSHTETARSKSLARLIIEVSRDVFYPQLDREQNWTDYRLLSQMYAKALKLEEDFIDARLKDFVEMVDLEMEAGDTGAMPAITDDTNTVKIATVHSSKGLEFKYVFVVNMVARSFPSDNRSDTIGLPLGLVKENLPTGDHHTEEERRLFYVAMTRAKHGLYLTGARDAGGKQEKKPSKFIAEIPNLVSVNFDFSSTGTELDRAIERGEFIEDSVVKYPVPKKISYSRLMAYEACPLRYKFAYVLNIPIDKKGSSAFGTTLHAVLAEFLQPLVLGSKQFNAEGELVTNPESLINLERFLEIFDRMWTVAGYDDKQSADDHYKLGKQYCVRFMDGLIESGLPKILGVEADFEYDFDGMILDGSIDRVDQLPDGTIRLVDYKTGEPKEKLAYEDKKQLLLYKLAAEKKYGQQVSAMTFYYFKSNEWLGFTATAKDLDKIQLEVKEIIESIKAGDFRAKPSHLCRYCDFKNICEFKQG